MKKFNVLIDTPPESVTVNEREYPINSDYKTVLSYLRLYRDETMSNEDKFSWALALFYGNTVEGQLLCSLDPNDVEALYSYIAVFVNCGEEPEQDEKKKTEEPALDLLVDSGRIFAAFYQIYGINLRKASIHWWVFMDLLQGLPKGTRLADVIDIRTKEKEKWMDAKTWNDILDMKKIYAIKEKKDGDFSILANLWR